MSDEIFAAVHARPKRRQGITGQTIDAQMRGTMCQITEWELEELCDELARLSAALADERAHADALEASTDELMSYAHSEYDGVWSDEDFDTIKAPYLMKLLQHRARRQG